MPRGNVRVSITGDADGLSRATRGAERDLDRFGKNTSRAFAAVKAAAATAGLAIGGAAAVLAVDSVKAAVEAEKSQARLAAQLKASGISWKRHADEIDRVIQKHSLLSGLDDEDLQDAFTNIVRVSGDVDKSLRLTGLAADFARAKHIDVAKAGELVAKVAGGNIGILSRYGITIKDGATATEALGILQQKFAGQAEAYGKTAGGSIDRLNVAWENLQERLGQQLLPILIDAADWLSRFVRQMETGKGAGGEFARTMVDVGKVLKVGLDILRFWIPLLLRLPKLWFDVGKAAVQVGKSIVNAIGDAFNFVKKLVGDVIAGILRRFATLFDVASRLPIIGDKFKGIADDVRDAASRVDRLGENIDKLPKKVPIKVQVDLLMKDFLSGNVPKLQPLPSGGPRDAIEQGAKVRGKQWALEHLDQIAPLLGAPGTAPGKLGLLEAIGHRMGLVTSSGYRPGDPGWHGKNRARDLAGPAGAMMAFAQRMFTQFGASLLELIYSPMRTGIKNGSPVNILGFYGPDVYADHFDHVHVAMARGGTTRRRVRALVGEEGPEIVDLPEGATVHPFSKSRRMIAAAMASMAFPAFAAGGTVGKFDATSYGPPWGGIQGTGVTATGVNLKGSPHLHGIAVDPSVLKLGQKYWVWPNPFGYRGPFKAFDTGGAIKGNRIDFYDWRGRSAQLGWGHKDVTVYSSDPFAGGATPSRPGMTVQRRNRRGRDRLSGPGVTQPRNLTPGQLLHGRDIINVGQEKGGEFFGGDGGGGGDQAQTDALNANTAAIEAHTQAINEAAALNTRLEYLLNKQSPQILDQMRALISTSMMRTVTLGRQAAGHPGRSASL